MSKNNYKDRWTKKICKSCGESYIVENNNQGNARKFCSRACFGKNNIILNLEKRLRRKEEKMLYQSKYNPSLFLEI